jgi:hypothetical protein
MTHIYGLKNEALAFVDSASKIAKEIAAAHAAEIDESARFPQETISDSVS